MISKRPHQHQTQLPSAEMLNTTVIENVAQTRQFADTSLSKLESQAGTAVSAQRIKTSQHHPNVEEDRPTNNTSNSQVVIKNFVRSLREKKTFFSMINLNIVVLLMTCYNLLLISMGCLCCSARGDTIICLL